jgi:SAM-dependent methyltransferase
MNQARGVEKGAAGPIGRDHFLLNVLRICNPLYLIGTKLRMWEDQAFDRKFKVDTERPVFLEQLSIPRESSADARFYVATPVRDFRRLVRKSGVDPESFTFVDLGCGKGRTLLLAEEAGFPRVIGVDADPGLCAIAAANAERWARLKRRPAQIEVISEDARRYEFPVGNLFVYLSNPFEGKVLHDVLHRLVRVGEDASRELVIAYNYNVAVDRIDSLGAFERTDLPPRLPWRRPTVSFHRPLQAHQEQGA